MHKPVDARSEIQETPAAIDRGQPTRADALADPEPAPVVQPTSSDVQGIDDRAPDDTPGTCFTQLMREWDREDERA